MSIRFLDELEFGFGWQELEPTRRTSHALAADGRVWLLDPVEGGGVEERAAALGEPAGVIQLLDRHARAGEAFATRLNVPLHVVPTALPGTPFMLLPVARRRFWSEVALWWDDRRVLVCGDALGTVPYFRAGHEPVGVHPLLRLRPPTALRGLRVEHLLVGHGRGLHGPEAAGAVEEALRTARRRIPRWLASAPRILRERD